MSRCEVSAPQFAQDVTQHAFEHEDNDPERNNPVNKRNLPRATKSCDQCKRLKVRCRPSGGDKCESCTTRNCECTWNMPNGKRGPRKKSRSDAEPVGNGATPRANPEPAEAKFKAWSDPTEGGIGFDDSPQLPLSPSPAPVGHGAMVQANPVPAFGNAGIQPTPPAQAHLMHGPSMVKRRGQWIHPINNDTGGTQGPVPPQQFQSPILPQQFQVPVPPQQSQDPVRQTGAVNYLWPSPAPPYPGWGDQSNSMGNGMGENQGPPPPPQQQGPGLHPSAGLPIEQLRLPVAPQPATAMRDWPTAMRDWPTTDPTLPVYCPNESGLSESDGTNDFLVPEYQEPLLVFANWFGDFNQEIEEVK
ncbi:hypothetical protein F4778DRAFT_727666 [Xylariomycetidae sp. FL2044]|nr:hypothetical protein F4778DRAFT_727666 [Xylariomycetidae sp. FL2044]